MPNTSSAKKAMRQSATRRERNSATKDSYKRSLKTFRKTTKESPAEAPKLLDATYKALDKAAKSGVIKKNKASRLKSRATKLIKK